MRLLWHSTKPNIPTGYGAQTNLMIQEITRSGRSVDVSCSSGLYGATEVRHYDDRVVRLFPHSNYPAKYGTDTVEMHFKHSHADAVWSFIDCFIFDKAVCSRLPWMAWVPVDSEPVMIRNVEPLRACRWRAALTEWGKAQVERAGLECGYIPCAYAKEQYFPGDKVKAKETLSRLFKRDLTKNRIVNVVSANTGSRKNFPAIFAAWKIVQDEVPDAVLYIHADPTGYFTSGEDLMPLFDLFGVDGGRVIFAPVWQYVCGMIGVDYLRAVYQASELHLNTCYGEGFGIPILEAMACGCPCVVPEFGGAMELVGSGGDGLFIKGRRVVTVPGAHQFLVDDHDVADAILQILEGEISFQTDKIAKAASRYEVATVFGQHIEPMLVRMEKELKCSPVS